MSDSEHDSSEEYDDVNFDVMIDGVDRLTVAAITTPPSHTGDSIQDSDITFDRSLPGLHTYLGQDVVNVDGRVHVDPGTILFLRAFYRHGIILVPGYTLPMLVQATTELEILNSFRDPVVILPGCFPRSISYNDFIGLVGTVADLMTIRRNGDLQNPVFLGRQRIRILDVKPSYENDRLMCRGVVLPEISVDKKDDMSETPFGIGLIPPSWCHFAPEPDFAGTLNPGDKKSQADQITSPRRPSSSQPSKFLPTPMHGHPLAMFDSSLSTWRTPSQTCACDSTAENVEKKETPPSKKDKKYGSTILGKRSASLEELYVSCDDDDDNSEDLKQHLCVPIITATGLKRRWQLSVKKDCTSISSITSKGMEKVEWVIDKAVDRSGRPFRYRMDRALQPRLLCRRDVLASVAHSILPLPAWVYRQYDTCYLVAEIRAELSQWTNTWHMDHWNPNLAVPFSYWLVQNLPIPCSLKASLLEIDHVIQRLRALLNVIRQCSELVCCSCRKEMTSQKDVICLAQEGSLQTFVNPHGIVFDMLTLSKVEQGAIKLQGSASSEYSWFPGYAWTCAMCVGCSNYIGWLFTAESKELRPKMFWGIKRDALTPKVDASSSHMTLML